MNIIRSHIIPIPRKDIDTDIIIPAQFLVGTTQEGLGKHLFAHLREQEKDFPLNDKRYHGGEILVTGENFGCGSSREHAVWALKDFGIKVILAESFADIFYNNALKNHLLPIKLPSKIIEEIFEQEKKQFPYEIEVNLYEQKVYLVHEIEGRDMRKNIVPHVLRFEINPYRKECLIKEISDFDYLLENLGNIKKYENKHKKYIFFNISKI